MYGGQFSKKIEMTKYGNLKLKMSENYIFIEKIFFLYFWNL